jgi:hypothetical protein
MTTRCARPLLTIAVALTLVTPGALAAAPAADATAAQRRADAADGEVFGHFYERGPDGRIIEQILPLTDGPAAPALTVSAVSEQQIASRLRRADSGRAADLADVAKAPPAPRLVPEDLTRRARVIHMGVENYTDAAMAETVARIGGLESFSVVARLAPGHPWIGEVARVPNLTVAELPGVQYVWTEDVTEIGVDGAFRMTARMGDRGLLLRRSLFVDRVRRYYPDVTPAEIEAIQNLPPGPASRPGILPDEVMRRYPDTMYMNQGLVEADGAQAVAAAISEARGAPMREDMLYLEGGNVLLGTLPRGEPYALVGRDSVAIARAVLAHHSGNPVSDAELRAAMAKDLGVAPAHLFLVEQPGVFHLDMAMTLLRPGTVLLNDATEALALQTQWLREDHEAWRPRPDTATPQDHRQELAAWQQAGRDLEDTIQKLRKYAERFARFEARTLADVEAAGLTVVRVPARFLHPTRPWDRDIMNFVNGEAGTNPQGRTYFITQGGDPRAERHVATTLLTRAIGLDRVYFAPRLASRDSLWEKGGVGCRIKVEGSVVENPTLPPPR